MLQTRAAVGDTAGGGPHNSSKMSSGADKGVRGLTRRDKVNYILTLMKKRDSAVDEVRRRIKANTSIKAKGAEFSADVMAEALQIYNEQRALRPAPSTAPDLGKQRAAAAHDPVRQRPVEPTVDNGASRAANLAGGHLKRKCPSPVRGQEGHSSNGNMPPAKLARHQPTNFEHAQKVDDVAQVQTPCRSTRAPPQTAPKLKQVPEQHSRSTHAEVPAGRAVESVYFRSTHAEVPAGKAVKSVSEGDASSSSSSSSSSGSSSSGCTGHSASPHNAFGDFLKRASPAPAPQPASTQRESSIPEPHPEPCPSASPTPARARAAPSTSESTPSTASVGTSASDLSVKELKGLLAEHRIDFSRCVEKADLRALWNRFEILRQRPLQELQDSCAARGARPLPQTANECAARLLAEDTAPVAASDVAGLERSASSTSVVTEDVAPSADVANREMEAKKEVNRISSLRRESFPSSAAWGYAVLSVTTKDLASVQRGYRSLMKKLHPDKVQHTGPVSKAVEACREAKEACERGLSRQDLPGQPRHLSFKAECLTPGQRQFRINWQPPVVRESTPVRRYIVAAFDPAYGKALTVAVLEPDYSEELRRFVSVEELGSYVLSERELTKMPKLWQQTFATIQVAAANEAGQSSWASLQVALDGRQPTPKAISGLSSLMGQLGGGSGFGGSQISADSRQSEIREMNNFAVALNTRRIDGDSHSLRSWLDKQRKPLLQGWLQSNDVAAEGTKEILVERVLWVLKQRSLR